MKRKRSRRARLVASACFWAVLALGIPFDRAAAFEDMEVPAFVANVKKPEDYPGQGGIWMGRDRHVRVDGMGGMEITEHLIARVFDPGWAERNFAPYSRLYWAYPTRGAVDRARVWKSSAEFRDVPMSSIVDRPAPIAHGLASLDYLRECAIDFGALEPGDVVEVRLKWAIPFHVRIPDLRFCADVFGAAEPIVEQQLRIEGPSTLRMNAEVFGPAPLRRAYPKDGSYWEVFLAGNLPAMQGTFVETPNARFVEAGDSTVAGMTRVVVTSAGNWGFVSSVLAPAWKEAGAYRSPVMDQWVAGVLAESKSDLEKARALARLVKEKVRPLEVPHVHTGILPLPPAAIVADGRATPRDRSLLLATLLQMAGVAATPVAARTSRGPWDPDVPCLLELDRSLVRVSLSGGGYAWFDLHEEASDTPPTLGLPFDPSAEGFDRVKLLPIPVIEE